MPSQIGKNPSPPDTDPVSEKLLSRLESFGALPYLFVGSGISRRYLDLPDWHGLLRIFANQAGVNYDQATASSNNNLPKIASYIAAQFNESWWSSEKYSELKKAWSGKFSSIDSALKVAIADFIVSNQNLSPGKPGYDNPKLHDEVESLKNVVIDGIISTNYDNFLEELFPDLEPFIGQSALLFGEAQFISEIYKIHGSASDPFSMLVTADDYAEFSDRNKYLSAKLLTIFAEHPVIFVGYSLNDEYLAEILYDIARAVGPERVDELGKRIIFVEWNRSPDFLPIIESSSIVRGKNQEIRLPITRIESHNFKWIWDSLQKLNRPFPPKLLRQLREHVYNLVVNPDPSQKMETVRALPMDAEGADDVNVVFGVARLSEQDRNALSGITARAFTISDIIDDVLGKRSLPLQASNILEVVIPEIIRPNSRSYLPVYKYLHEEGRIPNDGNIDFSSFKPAIERVASKEIRIPQESRNRFNRDIKNSCNSPLEVLQLNLATVFSIDAICLLDSSKYDIEDLRKALLELEERTEASAPATSEFKKLLCHYDRLKYLDRSEISDISSD